MIIGFLRRGRDSVATQNLRKRVLVASGAASFALFLAVVFYLRQISVAGTPQGYLYLEVGGTLVSFCYAANALVRFRGTHDRTALILAFGFVLSGIIETVGCFGLNDWLSSGALALSRIPMGWMVSRTLLAVLLLAAIAVERYMPTARQPSKETAMAIGRTFKEAFQKGLRALEVGRSGWEAGQILADDRLTSDTPEDLRVALRTPTPERIFQIKRALVAGVSIDDIATASGIDPWFLFQLAELLVAEREFVALPQPGAADLRRMKRMGFSDRQLAALRGTTEQAMREARWRWGVHPAYKTVDTCAGEFPSRTPYLYSSYDDENELYR